MIAPNTYGGGGFHKLTHCVSLGLLGSRCLGGITVKGFVRMSVKDGGSGHRRRQGQHADYSGV